MKPTPLLFKSLADETRLRLLALLTAGELCVCELMEVLDLPQSTVSRHLATLRRAGWVEGRRQGVWMYYRLATDLPPLQSELLELLERRLHGVAHVGEDRLVLQGIRRRSDGGAC